MTITFIIVTVIYILMTMLDLILINKLSEENDRRYNYLQRQIKVLEYEVDRMQNKVYGSSEPEVWEDSYDV